jgi:hypothetical protein
LKQFKILDLDLSHGETLLYSGGDPDKAENWKCIKINVDDKKMRASDKYGRKIFIVAGLICLISLILIHGFILLRGN